LMNKVIMILKGSQELKERVNTLARDVKNEDGSSKYWTWNISYLDQVKSILPKLHIKSVNQHIDEYAVSDLLAVLNKYYNFTEEYLDDKIDKFKEDAHANVLFISDCEEEQSNDLVANEDNVWVIQLGKKDGENDIQIYDDDGFNMEFLRNLNILTKDVMSKKEIE
jgi:hypothetical protein